MSVIPRRVRLAQLLSHPGTDGLPQPDRLPEERDRALLHRKRTAFGEYEETEH